jgi:hypothetical protein
VPRDGLHGASSVAVIVESHPGGIKRKRKTPQEGDPPWGVAND